MIARLNSWREKNKQRLIIIMLVITVVLIVFILASHYHQGVKE